MATPTPIPITTLGTWRRIARLEMAEPMTGDGWQALKADHAARLGRPHQPAAPSGQLVQITAAPRRPRHRLTLTPKTEPGDAA